MTVRQLLGVVHVPPLPGTPFHRPGSLPTVLDDALHELHAMAEGGLHGALLQTEERVYSTRDEADPARVAGMSVLLARARERLPAEFELGVQIMRHGVSASLAVSKVAGGSFVRVDALVGATLSTHGVVEPDSQAIMTYRRSIDAFDVRMVADVESMHYRWAFEERPTWDVARRALLVGADAVCVALPDPDACARVVREIREHVDGAEILLGGFVTLENAATLLAHADGAFVSGCLRDPASPGKVDLQRVRALVETVGALG